MTDIRLQVEGSETSKRTLDDCEVCLGRQGGVKGNENIINSVVTCDYCSAEQTGKDND